MSHRPTAAVAGTAAALLIAAVGASPAPAAAVSPKATLASAKQSTLLGARRAVVGVASPAHSAIAVTLYSNGHKVSSTRRLAVRRAGSVRLGLALTTAGLQRLRHCDAQTLEVRLTVRRGKHTTTVRVRRALKLDAHRCPAPAPKSKPAAGDHAPAPATPAVTTPTDHTPTTPTDQTPATPPGDDPQDQSLFRVGTSVVDITPDKAMTVGGYGANFILNSVHDPLQVRAFFVGRGHKAVTFVSVDSQGWFASYQSPNAGDGAADARNDAAAILASRGYDVSAANVVVSATHDHAAPTIQGIWGHTDPDYLHKVKLAAVQAVADAEAHAQDAELWSATGTIKGLVSQVQGTDQMAGFAVDTSLPILWAREPGTGKTLGMYADVPVHVDEYDPTEATNPGWSADYPGWVRNQIADTLGGTAVIAAGTLGRQEAIGASSEYDEVAEQGRFITNQMMQALANAHRITDTTLDANMQSFSTPAENSNLLMAMACNHSGGGCPFGNEPAGNNATGTWFLPNPANIFTINRAITAPWFTPSPNVLGTTSTVARIGDQVFATAPGEAFPEVTSAIQRSFAASNGISGVHIIDHAGDQLGYYWDQRPGIYPDAQIAQSDFVRFNVGSHLAQDNVNAARAAGVALGLAPTAQDAFADKQDPDAFSKPHVQFYSNRVETANPTVSLYSSAKKAQSNSLGSTTIGSSAGTQNDNSVTFDYGDGTTETRPASTRFDHTFPHPGTYEVKATIVDNLGAPYSWTQTVVIDQPLSAAVDQSTKNGKLVLTARAVGGAGDVVGAHWAFSDATTADGVSVRRTGGATTATVTIVDGAGNTATATVPVG